MNSFLKNLFYKDKRVIIYFVLSLSIIISSYLIYLVFNEDTIIKLGAEDGFFEYFTALLFLVTSILFIIIYFLRKKLIHLVFALVFFIGMGEEVSWGQRIFNYQSPEYFKENNIQREFNLHNLSIFDSEDAGGKSKDRSFSLPFDEFPLQTFLADLWYYPASSLFTFSFCEEYCRKN